MSENASPKIPLNPAAAVFEPRSVNLVATRVPEQPTEPALPRNTNEKKIYGIYKNRRQATIHSIMRDAHESAKAPTSSTDFVTDDNAKDKLIISLTRLLAGLGWSTSTTIRAAVLLEDDPFKSSLECLEEAEETGRASRERTQ